MDAISPVNRVDSTQVSPLPVLFPRPIRVLAIAMPSGLIEQGLG